MATTRERIAGRWVGDMRVLARCEDREFESGFREQWLCRCSCGKLQKRTRDNIIFAIKNNKNMCCRECASELKSGTIYFSEYQKRLDLMIAWGHFRDLYNPYSIGLPDFEQDDSLDVSESSPMPNVSETQQRMSDLRRAEFSVEVRCVDCLKCITSGWACLRCVEAVCDGCVEAEIHRHAGSDGMTLKEIASVFGMTREGVRQIESRALQKMRDLFKM